MRYSNFQKVCAIYLFILFIYIITRKDQIVNTKYFKSWKNIPTSHKIRYVFIYITGKYLAFFTEGNHTNRPVKPLPEQYAACPTSKELHEIDGKTYLVTRHFTKEKDLGKIILELAREQAMRNVVNQCNVLQKKSDL